MTLWQAVQIMVSPAGRTPPVSIIDTRERKEKFLILRAIFRGSVAEQFLHSHHHIIRLRQNHIFELRLVRTERVRSRNALYWGIQLIKKFVGNTRRNFCAVA